MCCFDYIQFLITPEDDRASIYWVYIVLLARATSKKLSENQFSYLNPTIRELGEGLEIHVILL